jgi:hypothetical protein
MDELTAISKARQLIDKHGPIRAPVDIVAIAAAEGFEVKESDKLEPGLAGMLLQRGDRKMIVTNKNDHPYRRRFTIAHELAHEILGLPSVHGSSLKINELERYGKRPKEEILCDVFASECLVPWRLIQPQANALPFSIDTITDLSQKYEASKPCVASRFAQSSSELLVYVPIETGIVRHAIASKALREHGVWITIGAKIPRNSAAQQAKEKGFGVAITDLDGADWSQSDVASNYDCHEEAFYLDDFDQGYSLITFEKFTSTTRAYTQPDEDEDNERLSPLTGYFGWDKR